LNISMSRLEIDRQTKVNPYPETVVGVGNKDIWISCTKNYQDWRSFLRHRALFGFEVLNLNKCQLNSLDFAANRFMVKHFYTNNMQIIEFCCHQFNFILPSGQIANRRDKFIKSNSQLSQHTNLLTFINM